MIEFITLKRLNIFATELTFGYQITHASQKAALFESNKR